jgi:hypothetical protein
MIIFVQSEYYFAWGYSLYLNPYFGRSKKFIECLLFSLTDISASGMYLLYCSSYYYCSQVLCANSFLAVSVLAPAIAMHVRMDFKSLLEPDWSVERTNAFYYSKLILVLHDLKCSGLVGLSPESNEKKSINTLLDYMTSSHLHVKKGEC